MNTVKLLPILFVFLTSCNTVFIKDTEWCQDFNGGALCRYTFSDQEREISEENWDNERASMVCTNVENFSEWKQAILKLCAKTKKCKFVEEENAEKTLGN